MLDDGATLARAIIDSHSYRAVASEHFVLGERVPVSPSLPPSTRAGGGGTS